MNLVSVVIPNYNHAGYLDQRIQSVLNQTYPAIEVILLDDCSADNSREVMEKYRHHSRVTHLVFNETNSGSPFKQWDKGIRLAKGDWIWIAESDDWCEPDFLEKIMEITGDDTVLSFCQSKVINQEGRIIWETKWDIPRELIPGRDFFKQYLLYGNTIVNASMCIFRKDAYLKVPSDFREFRFCGDWVLWMMLLQEGQVAVRAEQLNYFRKHDKDVSGKAYSDGFGYKEIQKVPFLLQKHRLLSDPEVKKMLSYHFVLFLNDSRVRQPARQQLLKSFIKKIGFPAYFLMLKNSLKNKKRKAGRLLKNK